MGLEDNGDVGFQQHGVPNCPSSRMESNSMSDKVAVMAMCSDSMFKSPTGEEAFYGSGWDPLVTLSHGENFGAPHTEFANSHYTGLLENKSVGSSSHLVHYPSDSVLVNMVPKIPCFGSGNFSVMASSLGLAGCGQVREAGFPPSYTSVKPVGSQEDCLVSEEGALCSSPNGKKKRKAPESHSSFNTKKSAEGDQQKAPSGNSSELSKEKVETKQKVEQNNSGNSRGKQPCKQTKDNSMGEEPSKDTYIHVRAKRGQATNSHSLAERVRREKITERMRLLQELVPGCNKITGKAVMLDEIINYVQSLQHQVEFLSMKLATVNPELNFDFDRMISKDILHSSRGTNEAALHIGPGLNSSLMFPAFSHGPFPGIPDASPAFHPLPQSLWENELQNVFQMGFDSNTSNGISAQNGRSKLEP